MQIETYHGAYTDEIISLILAIQNNEAGIGLTLEEQPDLLDIGRCYQRAGGEFWVALHDGKVIGTIGLMVKERNCAVLKKLFVKKNFARKRSALRFIGNF